MNQILKIIETELKEVNFLIKHISQLKVAMHFPFKKINWFTNNDFDLFRSLISSTKSDKDAHKKIESKLKYNCPNLLKNHEDFCKNLIAIATTNNLRCKYEIKYFEDILKIKTKPLINFYEYHYLYQLLLTFGHFNLAFLVRQHIYASAKKENFLLRFSYRYIKMLYFIIEAGDITKFNAKLKNLYYYNSNCKFLLILLSILLFRKNNSDLLDKKSNNEFSRNFFNKIYNKDVILIGPKKTYADKSKNKKKHSKVIATINFTDINFYSDLIYFNDYSIKYISETFLRKSLSNKNTNFLIFKNERSLNNYIKIKKSFNFIGSSVEIRNSLSFDSIVSGDLNMGVISALDIISANPRSLKLKNFDLMLTRKRTTSYYLESKYLQEREKIYVIKSFIQHDPLTQYFILSTLLKNKKIKCDANLNNILEGGPRLYMSRLEKVYGKSARINMDKIS